MSQLMNEIIHDVKKVLNNKEASDLNVSKYVTRGLAEGYGWHNPHFPPELRRASLKGLPLKTDKHTEIYILMSSWYETISGSRPPCSFTLYKNWKTKLRQEAEKTHRLTTKEIEQLIRAIEAGTHHKKEKRDAEKVLSLLPGSQDS